MLKPSYEYYDEILSLVFVNPETLNKEYIYEFFKEDFENIYQVRSVSPKNEYLSELQGLGQKILDQCALKTLSQNIKTSDQNKTPKSSNRSSGKSRDESRNKSSDKSNEKPNKFFNSTVNIETATN